MVAAAASVAIVVAASGAASAAVAAASRCHKDHPRPCWVNRLACWNFGSPLFNNTAHFISAKSHIFCRQTPLVPHPFFVELGTFSHACEGEMVYKMVPTEKVPKFNHPVYTHDKVEVGKVDEIFGSTTEPVGSSSIFSHGTHSSSVKLDFCSSTCVSHGFLLFTFIISEGPPGAVNWHWASCPNPSHFFFPSHAVLHSEAQPGLCGHQLQGR